MNIREIAKTKEYPGRFLIVDHQDDRIYFIYGVTARSEASKSKQYQFFSEQNEIRVMAIDENVMGQGDLSLLDYTSAKIMLNGVVIGNGRQVNDFNFDCGNNTFDVFQEQLAHWEYEDDKYKTPRITAGVLFNKDLFPALSIIREEYGQSKLDIYNVNQGESYFISTYDGENTRPTPSFKGEPIKLNSFAGNLEEFVHVVYNIFESVNDLRVSFIGVEVNKSNHDVSHYIINHFE